MALTPIKPKVEILEIEKPDTDVIEVIEQGPIGPVGPQGPQGPAGESADLSSPPPIGDVTPNTGDFTVVSATDWVEATFITTPNQQAEITLNDTTGDIAINANSGAGTISLLADNTIGEDIQADKFSLNTAAAAIAGVGEMVWNDTDGTIDLGLKGGNSTLQLGQELVLRVKNDDSVQLTDGMVVYVSGANGTNLLVKRAEANAELTSASTIGVVTEPIAVNGHGYITTFGVVRGINTNGFNAGDILYLSPSVAGELTNVKPTAPNHMVMVGFVVKKSAGSGEVFVQVQNGYELDELHNVLISGVAAGQLLRRNAGNTLWENHTLTPADIGAAPDDLSTLYDGALSQVGASMYDGTLQIFGANGSANLNTDNLTAARSHYFPDATGTLALTSDIPTTFAASAITSGTLDAARLGSGSASSGTWLRGDSTWQALPAAGTKTYARWTALDNQPPSTAFATLDTRNSVAVLDFDDASTESAVFVGVMPEGAVVSSGLIVVLKWMATTATSGDVRWSVDFERCTNDLDADSFDTATAATATTNGTSGIVTSTSITCTTIDSIVAGDLFRVRVQRVGGNAADTMSGDAELIAVEVRSAA